jgi:hypothetical protein
MKVPVLLALQGDIQHPQIRTLALKLLCEEVTKRPDILRQRFIAVRSFMLFLIEKDLSIELFFSFLVRASIVAIVYSRLFTMGHSKRLRSLVTRRRKRTHCPSVYLDKCSRKAFEEVESIVNEY